MSYVWFNNVLHALGRRLNYESISNLYGNSFAKDSAKYVNQAYPLTAEGKSSGGNITQLFSKIKVVESKDKSAAIKTAEKTVGDLSWVLDFNKEKEN